MRIDDASHLPTGNEHTTLVRTSIAEGQLSVLQIEAEDTSLEVVIAALRHHGRPVIISLAEASPLFSEMQDFARIKEANVSIISFVIPQGRIATVGKLAYEANFHFTSQLAKALQRSDSIQQTPVSYQREATMQNHSETSWLTTQEKPSPSDQSKYNPVTPIPESFLEDPPTPLKRKKRMRQVLLIIVIISVLIVVSAALLPSLLIQPMTNTLTVPQGTGSTGSVGNLSFASSGQLDPTSATGLNDIITLNLTGLTSPSPGMSDYAWLEAEQTQDEIAPILLGKLQIVGGKAQLTYQDQQHTDLLVTYSRMLITEQADNVNPTTPPLDSKAWRYQGGIPTTPTPGDEKGYSLLSHLRHLLAKDPTLNELGLQGGLDIWLYRNIGKVLEWSNAARDDWGNAGLIQPLTDRIIEYLDGQIYAVQDLPAGTPWLVDPHAGRPGIIDFDNAQDEQGPPSYLSHVKLHLAGLINAPGHTAAQEQQATRIDNALSQIESLLRKVRSDAVQLAKMDATQLNQPNALDLLNDMQINANNAYVGQTNPMTGAVQAGEVWVHQQFQSLATIPVTTVTNS